MSPTPKKLDAVTKMVFAFDVSHRDAVVIDAQISVPASFTAYLQVRNFGDVELDVVAQPGRTRVVAARVTESTPGQGVSNLTIARLPIQRLLEASTRGMAWIYGPNRAGSSAVGSAAHRATRRKVSDDRIERVAEVLDAGGGEAEVMAAEHVGDRQARRLMRLARERAGRSAS